MVSDRLFDDVSTDSGLGQSRQHAQSGSDTSDTGEKELKGSSTDVMTLKSLLSDCGSPSVSHLRWVFLSAAS